MIALARGSADASELLASNGTGLVLLLLPALVGFAAAVAVARLLPLALRGLERVVPENALALRLAALGLARRPGYAAVAVAFVVVSVGFALFASSYRSTLVVAQQQEAAFAVPADEVVQRGPLAADPGALGGDAAGRALAGRAREPRDAGRRQHRRRRRDRDHRARPAARHAGGDRRLALRLRLGRAAGARARRRPAAARSRCAGRGSRPTRSTSRCRWSSSGTQLGLVAYVAAPDGSFVPDSPGPQRGAAPAGARRARCRRARAAAGSSRSGSSRRRSWRSAAPTRALRRSARSRSARRASTAGR